MLVLHSVCHLREILCSRAKAGLDLPGGVWGRLSTREPLPACPLYCQLTSPPGPAGWLKHCLDKWIFVSTWMCPPPLREGGQGNAETRIPSNVILICVPNRNDAKPPPTIINSRLQWLMQDAVWMHQVCFYIHFKVFFFYNVVLFNSVILITILWFLWWCVKTNKQTKNICYIFICMEGFCYLLLYSVLPWSSLHVLT